MRMKTKLKKSKFRSSSDRKNFELDQNSGEISVGRLTVKYKIQDSSRAKMARLFNRPTLNVRII